MKNAILKSLLWVFLTLIFGLLQSWIILGESMILSDNSIASRAIERLINSGAFLFFSTAIIASLTLDYFLLRKVNLSKTLMGILFVLFPVIILIICISLFHQIEKDIESINFDILSIIELTILVLTCLYAVIVKTILTLDDEKSHLKIQSKVPSDTNKNSIVILKRHKKPLLGFDKKNDPFIIGQPVRYAHFFGRDEIIENLFKLWKKFPIQNAAIYGEKRIGKTSLLRYLKDVVDNPNNSLFREKQKTDYLPNSKQYCFIYVDFQDVEYHSPKRLLEYVLQNMTLEQAKQLDLSLSEDNPLLYFGRILSDHLIKPTIILMDEIGVVLERHPDQFDNDFWEGLRSIVTTKLEPQCLGFVLSSHQHPHELVKKLSTIGAYSPFFNIFGYTEELKAFTEQEARALIASSPKPFSDDDVQFILKHSELKPYLLQILCHRAFEAKELNWQPEAEKEMNKIKSGLNHV